MTEQERIESYIANCKCCLLAQSMRECPLCLFNLGLAVPVDLYIKPAPLPHPVEEIPLLHLA